MVTEQEEQPQQPPSKMQTAKLEHEKERVRAKIETLKNRSEPVWFKRTVLAIVLFIAVWKTSVFLGMHTWLGGSLMAAAIMLFPKVFRLESYSRLQSCNPTVYRALTTVACLAAAVFIDFLVELFKIPQ